MSPTPEEKDRDSAGAAAPPRTAGQPAPAALAEFARYIIRSYAWGQTVDGGDVQDAAARMGLIVEVAYDPALHGENDCDARPGDPWFVFSGALKMEGEWRVAVAEMLADHMTSELHHPNYVLVPASSFEKLRAVLEQGGVEEGLPGARSAEAPPTPDLNN